MRILICGSRHFNDYQKLCNEMDELNLDEVQLITIISGHARGADTLGEKYAEECGWELDVYPADWKTYGKRAGPIRNSKMLKEGKPDLVVAFRGPNSRGTQNMIDQSLKAGVKIIVHEIS